jgi:hypothetical protein
LDDEALSGLCGFSALTEFWTGNDNIFTDEAFVHIAKAPQLDGLLNMYSPSAGDQATEYVVAASKLRRYSILSAGITDYSFELLTQTPRLCHLQISS